MTRIHWLRYAVNALMVVVLVATTVVPEVSHGLLAALALLGLLEALARRDIAWRLPPEVLALAALPLVALLVTALAMLGGTDIPRLGWRKMEDLSWMFLLVPPGICFVATSMCARWRWAWDWPQRWQASGQPSRRMASRWVFARSAVPGNRLCSGFSAWPWQPRPRA